MTSPQRATDPAERLAGLATGDLVVYASHGVGRVAAVAYHGTGKKRHQVVVLEFAEGLSVTLPLARALEYLRPLSSEAELGSVQATLRADGSLGEEAWSKRIKVTREKVAAGEVVQLAEVVRDSAVREGGSSAQGRGALSPGERELYVKARRLLADEIGASRGIEASEADAWIDDQLVVAIRRDEERR